MSEAAANMDLRHVPPQDLEAEQMVLGAVLIEPEALGGIKDLLRPDDFYKTSHGSIFTSMLALSDKGQSIDLVTMSDALRGVGQFEKTGGGAYLASLVSLVPTAANIKHHARIVRRMKQLRDLDRACREAQARVYNLQDPDEIIAECVDALNGVRRHDIGTLMSYQEIMKIGFDTIEQRYENAKTGKISGIPSPFRELNRKLYGFQPQLYVVAGAPGMGKSAFADQCVRHAAAHFLQEWRETPEDDRTGKPAAAGVISLEMGPHQISLRAMSSMSGVPLSRLLAGTVHERDWTPLTNAAGRGCELPIYFEFSAFSDRQIERTIDYMVQVLGVKFLVFDYLQLGHCEGHAGTREQEVTALSRLHKRKIKQHGIPHILLSSLNRGLANRIDKRPTKADLRESGNIEFDADVIMFIYRDEVYNCKCPRDAECLCGRRGKAEIIIDKGKMEGTGAVPLRWKTNTTSFEDEEETYVNDRR